MRGDFLEQRFDTERRILNLEIPIDSDTLNEAVSLLCERYSALSVVMLGQSILGKRIPLLQLGQGTRKILYIGAHHGMEWLTAALLLRFVNEYCELRRCGAMAGNVPIKVLDEARSIYILPMLNPDGVDLALHGVDESNLLYERLLNMNGQSTDFSRWQANARGVDLNHNYRAGFEEYKKIEQKLGIQGGSSTRYSGNCPESEPEVGYLCNFLRFGEDIQMALSFHTQGEEIYYTSGGQTAPHSTRIARYLAGISGYRMAMPAGPAAYGGFTDWFIREFDRPAFTIECGKGKNPLPITELSSIYLRLRRLLFTAPMLI